MVAHFRKIELLENLLIISEECKMSDEPQQQHTIANSSKPVLVLDIDNTLICAGQIQCGNDSIQIVCRKNVFYVKTRPFLKEFLDLMRNYYEIYFFTSSVKIYGKKVIEHIAPGTPEDHCFYRDSCISADGCLIKDLSILQKPLEKMVLIDDSLASGLHFPNNIVGVPYWCGDPEDNVLQNILVPLLTQCACQQNVAESIISKARSIPSLVCFT